MGRIRRRIRKQNTRYREAIGPGFKLAVTLHHLATGNSYVDLAYSFHVADNNISKFVSEVYKVIIDEYLDEVFPAPSTEMSGKKKPTNFIDN